MKLKKLEKLRKNRKKIILGTIAILCTLGIGLLLGRTFSLYQVNKSFEFVNGKVNYYGKSDVYFAFYNGSTWLEEMPQKDNADNLIFDKAVCDNNTTISWNSATWEPTIKNLTKAKTRCALYFRKMTIVDKACEKGSGSLDCILAKIAGTTGNADSQLAYDDSSKNNLRYIGLSPNNYVSFNGELWRIIGSMNGININTTIYNGVLKLIRNNALSGRAWNSEASNDWSAASLNTYLQGRSYASNALVASVIWRLGAVDANAYRDYDARSFFENELASVGSASTPGKFSWTGKVGLMSPSDYGYAVGGDVRDTCLKAALISYSSNNCAANNWLYKSGSGNEEWTITSSSSVKRVFTLSLSGSITMSSPTVTTPSFRPVVYLLPSVTLKSGTGTSTSPFVFQ